MLPTGTVMADRLQEWISKEQTCKEMIEEMMAQAETLLGTGIKRERSKRMSRIAFIFPGQGAQVCGMGQDFYEQTEEGKEIFRQCKRYPGLLRAGAVFYGE